MKLKTHILILTFIALFNLPVFSQNVGDVILKNVNIDGKQTPKLVIVDSYYEYRKDGKEIYGHDLETREFFYEYDSKGNAVHKQTATPSGTMELWSEFDEKGNITHCKINSTVIGDMEYWREYDKKGNMIYEHRIGEETGDYEYWYEYDSDGNEIHGKTSSGFEYWYEYTFHPNGKVKTKKKICIALKQQGKSVKRCKNPLQNLEFIRKMSYPRGEKCKRLQKSPVD